MADKRVDELTDIDAVAGTDSIPIRDSSDSTELKEATMAQVATYVASAVDADDIDDTSTTNKFATAAQLSAVDALAATYQPLDSDLTAIAALSTTSYGRALLELANLAALQTVMGPTGTPSSSTFLRGDGSWATPAGGGGGDLLASNNLSDVDNAATALSNLGGQPLDSDLTAIAALTTTSFGRGLLEAANAAGLRTTLNVEDGATADQSASEILAALLTVDGAGSSLDADTLDGVQGSTYYSAGGTDVAVTDGGTGASTAAGARTSLDLYSTGEVDSAIDADVATHAAVTSGVHGISAFGATLVDDANNTAARTTLGLGTIATQAASSVNITGGTVTGITDLAVADGGTGASTVAAARSNLAPLNTVASSGASQTLLIGVNDITMSANCTFTFPTVGAGAHEFILILRGAFAPTFPGSVTWAGGAAPTYATPSEYSFHTVNGGTTWRGVGRTGFA